MRLPRSLGNLVWVAVFTLALPACVLAQTQEPVEFQGLEHSPLGTSTLSVTKEGGLKVTRGIRPSREDGVAISLPKTTNWTSGLAFERSSAAVERTVLTAMAEGSATSSSTLTTEGVTTSYAATFTGASESPTYSVTVYKKGVLQRAIGGRVNGTVGVRNSPFDGPVGTFPGPNCRESTVPANLCRQDCASAQYPSCAYCDTACPPPGFHLTHLGACEWRFPLVNPRVELVDGTVLEGDEIVLTEELRGASSYPYLAFDKMLIQSTATSMTLTSESVNLACQ